MSHVWVSVCPFVCVVSRARARARTHTHSLTHSLTYSLTHSHIDPGTIGRPCLTRRFVARSQKSCSPLIYLPRSHDTNPRAHYTHPPLGRSAELMRSTHAHTHTRTPCNDSGPCRTQTLAVFLALRTVTTVGQSLVRCMVAGRLLRSQLGPDKPNQKP